jgi:hypothetical protein
MAMARQGEDDMDASSAVVVTSRHQLCFRPLSTTGTVHAFPCDASGCVDLDALSDGERLTYMLARTLIGRDFRRPEVHRGPGGEIQSTG